MAMHFAKGSDREPKKGLMDRIFGDGGRSEIDELTAEVASLKAQMTPEMLEAGALSKRISTMDEAVKSLGQMIDEKQARLNEIEKQLAEKEKQIVTFDDAILVQEFGLYEPRFAFANSTQYKDKLADCRSRQKEAIKLFNSSVKNTQWTVNGSNAKGKKMVSETARLLMRAYNGECDEIVRKVKYTNINASLSQIEKSANAISRLGSVLGISVPPILVDLKKEEAQLAFEYAEQKQVEKEEQREAREQEREAAKLAKEIADKRKTLEKEKKKYRAAFDEIVARRKESGDSEDLRLKEEELRAKLEDVDLAIKDVDYREANQKAGFVYVISNVGSFGENVYKIGMTRRLNPQDRISELSDASVPFNFDVHALIFSDDAPALEAALHRSFESNKLNLVNHRREFFHVSLQEIEQCVKENYDKTVEFTEVPDAEQYRASQKMREARIS